MGVCLSSSETESKFMGSTQYSVMAERSSRRRGVKRTTRHKLRVCELMDATEGNNLKFSKSSLTPVKERIQIKKVKVLPPSVMMPFRSWMANAKRRVRDQIVADTTASCSDMSSDTVDAPRYAKLSDPSHQLQCECVHDNTKQRAQYVAPRCSARHRGLSPLS